MPRRVPAVVRSAGPYAIAFAALCAFACESPTLPLPPPEAPMQYPGVDADHIELKAGCGGAQPGANIFIINESIESCACDNAVSGSIANPCGAWDASVFAHSGDILSIQQEVDAQASGQTSYMVR